MIINTKYGDFVYLLNLSHAIYFYASNQDDNLARLTIYKYASN
jgi:hypothetical protein